jgi:hypothetical protein
MPNPDFFSLCTEALAHQAAAASRVLYESDIHSASLSNFKDALRGDRRLLLLPPNTLLTTPLSNLLVQGGLVKSKSRFSCFRLCLESDTQAQVKWICLRSKVVCKSTEPRSLTLDVCCGQKISSMVRSRWCAKGMSILCWGWINGNRLSTYVFLSYGSYHYIANKTPNRCCIYFIMRQIVE